MADQIVIFSTKIGLGYKKYLGKQTNLYGIDRYQKLISLLLFPKNLGFREAANLSIAHDPLVYRASPPTTLFTDQ